VSNTFEHLTAYRPDALDRQDEDEIITADMPDEALLPEDAPHHVVQDSGQQVDHAIAVVVTVAIVYSLK